MERNFAAEQFELDQLRLQLGAIQAAAMKAPAMGAFLMGRSLAKFMVTEEKRISIGERIAEIETSAARSGNFMRCYFMKDGHIQAVEGLPGLSDEQAIEKSHRLFQMKPKDQFDGFERFGIALAC